MPAKRAAKTRSPGERTSTEIDVAAKAISAYVGRLSRTYQGCVVSICFSMGAAGIASCTPREAKASPSVASSNCRMHCI